MVLSKPGTGRAGIPVAHRAVRSAGAVCALIGGAVSGLVPACSIGIVLACTLFSHPVLAQQAGTLTEAEKAEVIDTVVRYLRDNYVFPDSGAKVAARLLKYRREGRYARLGDAGEFARLLDSDLEQTSHDKHLALFYDPEMNAGLRQGSEEEIYPDEEMIEEERRGNYGFRQAAILEGNIGYLDLRIFFQPKHAGAAAVAAMGFLANSDALIIDLRNNGGGWGEMVAFFSSYFFSGDELVQLSSVYSRPEDKYFQSWTSAWVPGRHLADTPLYLLVSKSTFSAAEEFCYNLKHLGRAELIGETTRGGAHPVSYKAAGSRFVLMLPEMTSINPVTGSNWEGVGVEPHIEADPEKALQTAHLRALEALKAKAPGEKEAFWYQWHINGVKAKYDPVPLAEGTAGAYVGKYGSYEVTLADGALYYSRGGRMKHRLSPMTGSLFAVAGLDFLRLEFIREAGEVAGLNVLFADGRTSAYRKE